VASCYRNWNKRWPDGLLGTYTEFISTSELLFASFSERVLVQNVSHENDVIFMRMNVQVAYIFIWIVSHEDSFCHRGKNKLGIGLFIHELAQGAFDLYLLLFCLLHSNFDYICGWANKVYVCMYVLNVWLNCVVFNAFVAERILMLQWVLPMLILQAYQHLIETYKEVLFPRYGLFSGISMGTVVFQYRQINYFPIRCFKSQLSSNIRSVYFLQCVPIFFHFHDMIKPIFTSLPY